MSESLVEYGNTTDRLDTLENRLRLTKKTLNEVIAFVNGLETQITDLHATVKYLKDVIGTLQSEKEVRL
jgi:uncharacterized coiled-coil protein SlyX